MVRRMMMAEQSNEVLGPPITTPQAYWASLGATVSPVPGVAVNPPVATTVSPLAASSSAEVEYDQVPYPSYPERLTHPNNLATLGGILGLDTAPVETCRVLESGCASGRNIIPMAFGLPDNALANGQLQIFFAEVAGLHRTTPKLVDKPGDRPLATPLARPQARNQTGDHGGEAKPWATNQWHARVVLTPTQCAVLERFDGATSRNDIKRAIDKDLTSAEPVGQAIKALTDAAFIIA